MSKWGQGVMVVAVGALAFVAGRAIPAGSGVMAAQPDKGAAAQPDMAAMEALMQPGEHHRKLDAMLGTWEGTMKFWPAPGAEPMLCPGKATREWTLDGRFVVEHVEGEWMGQKFKGIGYTGYNTLENRYECVWLENMSTWITTSHGTADRAGKIFTFEGEMVNPVTGKREPSKCVVDMTSANEHIVIGFGVGPDGKEFKNCEARFIRK